MWVGFPPESRAASAQRALPAELRTMAGAARDAWQLKWLTLPKKLRPLSAGMVMALPQQPDFSPPTTCLLLHVKAGKPVLLNPSGSLKVPPPPAPSASGPAQPNPTHTRVVSRGCSNDNSRDGAPARAEWCHAYDLPSRRAAGPTHPARAHSARRAPAQRVAVAGVRSCRAWRVRRARCPLTLRAAAHTPVCSSGGRLPVAWRAAGTRRRQAAVRRHRRRQPR